MNTAIKMITDIKLRGSDAGMRSFTLTVADEFALKSELLCTNKLWYRCIVGRNAPRIRWLNSKVGAGLELNVNDAALLNAAEEEVQNWLRTNDKKFYDQLVST